MSSRYGFASVLSSSVIFRHRLEKKGQRWALFWKTPHAFCFPGLGHKMKLVCVCWIPLTNGACHFSLRTVSGSLKLQISREQIIQKCSWLLLETGGSYRQRNLDWICVCLTANVSSSLREGGGVGDTGFLLVKVVFHQWLEWAGQDLFLVSQWSSRRLTELRGS